MHPSVNSIQFTSKLRQEITAELQRLFPGCEIEAIQARTPEGLAYLTYPDAIIYDADNRRIKMVLSLFTGVEPQQVDIARWRSTQAAAQETGVPWGIILPSIVMRAEIKACFRNNGITPDKVFSFGYNKYLHLHIDELPDEGRPLAA